MNAADVLLYGRRTVTEALAKVPRAEWDAVGAAGEWSVKDVVAHLTSFQWVVADALNELLGSSDTPTLTRMLESDGSFDLAEVAQRRMLSADLIFDEYEQACAETERLVRLAPAEILRQPGTIPWYGREYSVDDLIVYMIYGHAREHAVHFTQAAERLNA
ncbi:MAG: DinB family protein [Dehalococcoidia bacterium]